MPGDFFFYGSPMLDSMVPRCDSEEALSYGSVTCATVYEKVYFPLETWYGDLETTARERPYIEEGNITSHCG